MNRATTGILLVALAVLAASCAADVEDNAPGPTVADARFDGVFQLEAMRVRGAEQDLVGSVAFDIDTEFGALSIDTPCGILLGSFSFFDDGRAGMTISGRAESTCNAAAQGLLLNLLGVLSRINEWSDRDSGFALESPQADSLTLSDDAPS